MKQYSGRVIGGPEMYRGTYHAVASNFLKLPLPLTVEPIGPAEIPTESIKNTIVAYRHQSMWWTNRETGQEWHFGFWVPIDIKEPQPFILDTLIESYVDANR